MVVRGETVPVITHAQDKPKGKKDDAAGKKDDGKKDDGKKDDAAGKKDSNQICGRRLLGLRGKCFI
jgi:hypothetical protein